MGWKATQRRPSDADLVRAAQAGDAVSFGVLLERHRPALHSVALRILHDPVLAEDAVHDSFLVALRDLSGVREPAAVAGWLHAVVRNQCLTELRRTSRELPPEAAEDITERVAIAGVDEQIDQSALRDWVWTALGTLSEPLRLTAMLRYFGSYTWYEEIAAISGVPVGTVRSRLSQVKVKLAIAVLSAWRESDFFTDQECSSLALAESVTRVAHTHVGDDDYSAALHALSEEQVSADGPSP